ncbi:MAG TPA: right-handed parallel beta-helix repeat-containing protein [Deinococcales bacterium]|nr:right-handed parallel beta-helix repeat-containing protein [Deinococcales bacterium]
MPGRTWPDAKARLQAGLSGGPWPSVRADLNATPANSATWPAVKARLQAASAEAVGPRALSLTGVTHWLDPGFGGTSDGSQGAPWKTWAEVTAAVAGNPSTAQTVALKAGAPLRVTSAITLPAKVTRLVGQNGASIKGSADWSLTQRAWTASPAGAPAGCYRTACDVTTAVSDTTADTATLRVNLAAAGYGITDPDAATLWARHRVLCFVDGAPLAWEDTLAACDGTPTRTDGASWGLTFAGTFYLDEAAGFLYVNVPSGLTGKLIEWVVAPALLTASGAGVTVENLIFAHAHAKAQSAAVNVNNGATLLHCDVSWSFGRNATASGGTFSWCYFHHAGQIGVGLFDGGGYYATIQDCEIAYCNTVQHSIAWEAGAHKSAYSHNVTWQRVYTHHNWGEGVWFDWSNQNFNVLASRSDYNRNSGFFIEVDGPSGTIQGLTGVGNGFGNIWRHVMAGLVVTSSHDITVQDCDFAWNANGVVVRRSSRNGSDPNGVENEVRNVKLQNVRVVQGDVGVRTGGNTGGGKTFSWVSDGDSSVPANVAKIWPDSYGNLGVGNGHGHVTEPSGLRAEWNGSTVTTLAGWQGTRVGPTDRVLTPTERADVLAKCHAPATAPARDGYGNLT